MMQLAENTTQRRYFLRHLTRYDYPEPVTQCYESGFLTPRVTSSQQVLAQGTQISPEPLLHTVHTDRFGNSNHYFEIHQPHTRFEVLKEALLEVQWPKIDVDRLDQWSLGSARRAVAGNPGYRLDRAMYGLPTQQIRPPQRLANFIESVLVPDLPFGQALIELTRGIYREFDYLPGATSVNTTVEELLELRAGVCQDFAHLGIAALRLLGIPARYVSGYLETQPPPGQPKLAGSDASHAWFSAMAPDGQWIDLDPTNNQFADSRYLVMAWGRDFADVSPLRGVIETDATDSQLSVAVDVVRVSQDQSPPFSIEVAAPVTG